VKTVLLVDDSPIQMAARQGVLSQAGFTVQIATSADTALSLLRSPVGETLDLIITDHIMPGTSGAEFVRMLRALKPDIPVVVISGMPEVDEEYEGLDVSFHQKPVPPPELIKLVSDLTK